MGEKSSSQEDVFFGFAEDLGLDMDEFPFGVRRSHNRREGRT